MSVYIIDRQAQLYPISLLQPQPNSDVTRHNIKVLSDASVVVQLPADTIKAISQIVAYLQVVTATEMLLHIYIDGQLHAKTRLYYNIDHSLYTDGTSCVWVQPDMPAQADSVLLRLNASCIHVYAQPARLTVVHWPLQAVANSQSQPITTELSELHFAEAGYNTDIQYSQGQLTLAIGPGRGLGKHPVSRELYSQDILSDADLQELTTSVPGLLSINGHVQDVIIRGSGTVQVQTSAAGDVITVHITNASGDTDGQNT